MPTTIEIQSGQVTNSKGSFSLIPLVRDKAGKDVPIHIITKDPRSGVSEPTGIINSVPSSKVKAVGGSWTTRRIEYEDGIYTKLLVRRTVGKKFGGIAEHVMAALMIRARGTAPLRELRIELPVDGNSTLSYLYITGRFDIVEPQELIDKKLYISNGKTNDLALFDPDNYEDFLQERVIEAEIAPLAKAKEVVEGAKTLTRPMRHRRIRVTKR